MNGHFITTSWLPSEEIKPRVAQVVDGVRAAAEPVPDGNADPYRDESAAAPEPPSDLDEDELPHAAGAAGPRIGDAQKATHELYRVFGAAIPLAKEWATRDAAVDKAGKAAAASLIQQRERILDLAEEILDRLVSQFCSASVHPEEWDLGALKDALQEVFNLRVTIDESNADRLAIAEQIWQQLETWIEARQTELRPLTFLALSRHFFLEEIDGSWIDHLKSMDHLREGIGLRGYAQKDPKLEYKKEGYNLFIDMMSRMNQNVAEKIFRVQLQAHEAPAHRPQASAPPTRSAPQVEVIPEFKHRERRIVTQHASALTSGAGQSGRAQAGFGDEPGSGPEEKQQPMVRAQPKVGRNEPCPCGSGKKYKKCHGATAVA